MFRNYLKTAIRNLVQSPVYALINVFGLSIGITCSLLIMIFIKHEISYDKFHHKKDDLYRMVFEFSDQDSRTVSPQMTAPVGPDMVIEFPEVIRSTRTSTYRSGFFSVEDRNYKSANVLYADSSFFEMFSFRLIQGDPLTVLTAPYSIVINDETASEIFGDENPVGKTIRWNNRDDLTITGIVETTPVHSHLQFTSLISFSSLYQDPRLYMHWNGGMQYYHYVELTPGYQKADLEAKLPDFMYEKINYLYDQFGSSIQAQLQPITDIHLRSGYGGEIGPVGSMSNIYIFSAVALFILFIACINFMNLTTAKSTRRAREVGLRKVLGAGQSKIASQFLGEAIIMSLIGLVISLILIEILLPVFSWMVSRDLTFYQLENIDLIIGVIFFVILVGIIAGSYPSFYVSSFKPATVLKGIHSGRGGSGFRNVLVLIQFAISIILIISTLVIYSQLGYIRAMDVGYQKENILMLNFSSDDFKGNYKLLKEELKNIPGIIGSAATSEVPGSGFTSNGYIPEGFDQPFMFNAVDVDYDYITTMGLQILSGRAFSPEFATDKESYMINEALQRKLNWDDPVGKRIERNGPHQVIGVVKDFHFASLHQEIGPLIFHMNPYMGYDHLLVRYRTDNVSALMQDIEAVWQRIDSSEPFEYQFLDEVFDNMYRGEKRMSTMLLYIAMLAIIIACMGLFGLALYNTEQRTKEIGVRKVYGSTVSRIVILLTGKFTIWVLIANALAWPVAYILMKKYMQMYAYKIDFPIWIFFLTALIAYLIALFTISFQSIKAGNANPADALRYE
ncbi:MAG: ABC transporter permease [Bacteroidales bacterium]|nr:ABC transporter permease [Bacteroidales bacterium]